MSTGHLALEAALLRVGAVQFGQFAAVTRDGFDPLRIDVPLLASYPALLADLARAMAPLVVQARESVPASSHLLAMPGALPVAFALSAETGLPLVYAAGDDSDRLQGAFDYSVPTLLITDVLGDGQAEAGMIRRVHRHGLDVVGALAVFDLGALESPLRGPHGTFTARRLWAADDLCRLAARSESLKSAVRAWLASLQAPAP